MIYHILKWITQEKYRRSKPFISLNRLVRYSRFITFTACNAMYGVSSQRREKKLAPKKLFFIEIKNSVDLQDIYENWTESNRLWNMGRYKEFCALSKIYLNKIYLLKKISNINYVPPNLSYDWCSAFGHLGSLGTFLTAQNLGIVSKDKRSLPLFTNAQANQISIFFKDKLNVIKSTYRGSMLEHVSQWHISERLMMIKVPGDFISLYELHEKVYKSLANKNSQKFIRIDTDYEVIAGMNLHKLGLPSDAWFVGFHVRENKTPFDPRYASLESFIPSLREIVANGGWVVRFGTGIMQPLGLHRNIIDLNIDTPANRFLHPYIIANSKFLLTTNSGPSVMAWALGTPVLQTNTTSIGRNILTASKGSIYLPKIWTYKGEKYSYARVVDSLEGYNETNLKEKDAAGFKLKENSDDEILEATKDILRSSTTCAQYSNNKERLRSIREDKNVVGYGEIAPSFLDKHQNWFFS